MEIGQEVLSYGGGVNTMAILAECVKKGERPGRIVFADTGAEWPETIGYLHDFAVPFVKEKMGLEIEVVQAAEGSIMDYSRKTKMTPHRRFRWCTRMFKQVPIRKVVRPIDRTWIGIDAKEQHRADHMLENHDIKFSRIPRFPLIEWGMDREDCARSIKSVGLPVPQKSGCYICPFQRKDQWATLKRRHPNLFEEAVKIEQGAKNYNNGAYMYDKPLEEWVHEAILNQGVLFELNEGEPCMVCEMWDEDTLK